MIAYIETLLRLALLNRWVTFLTASVVTLLVVGCATERFAWRDRLTPWANNAPTTTDGSTTVVGRIEEMRQLQRTATRMTDFERTEVARRLTEMISSDAEPAIKAQAVESLGYLNTETSIEGLQAAMQDADPDMRTTACRSLGRLGSRSAMRLLIETQRSDTNIDVRQTAIQQLGKFKDPAAVAALGESLTDSDPAVQLLTMRSLRQATGEKLGDDLRRWKEHVASLPRGGTRLAEEPTDRR